MPEVAVQVEDKRYCAQYRLIRAFCRKMVVSAWESGEPSEVSVVLADDDFVHVLNRDYRGQDKPTNVLSFENAIRPPKGQPWLAGDIILAYETVEKEAQALKIPFLTHLAHLLIHGALHLQGYDHLNEKEAQKMESKETTVMNKLGYPDPYQDVE